VGRAQGKRADDPVIIRPQPPNVIRAYIPGDEGDDPLVYDSWMHQIRRCHPWCAWPRPVFDRYRETVAYLLANSRTILAVHPTKTMVYYGWACGGVTEDGLQVLHMIYVRDQWRRRHIATKLLDHLLPAFKEEPIYFSQKTKVWPHYRPRWQLHHHPYMVEELT
jgi:GNAT superfamily N-acetyltransferase